MPLLISFVFVMFCDPRQPDRKDFKTEFSHNDFEKLQSDFYVASWNMIGPIGVLWGDKPGATARVWSWLKQEAAHAFKQLQTGKDAAVAFVLSEPGNKLKDSQL